MLVPTVLFFSAACALLIAYALLAGRRKRQLALITDQVRGDVDFKVKKSRELDDRLARRLAEGRAISTTIGDWQRERGEILATGKTHRPWCWSAEDLQGWADQRVASLAAEITRTAGVLLVILTVSTLAAAVLGSLGYYHFYAQRGVSSANRSVEATADPWATNSSLPDTTSSPSFDGLGP